MSSAVAWSWMVSASFSWPNMESSGTVSSACVKSFLYTDCWRLTGRLDASSSESDSSASCIGIVVAIDSTVPSTLWRPSSASSNAPEPLDRNDWTDEDGRSWLPAGPASAMPGWPAAAWPATGTPASISSSFSAGAALIWPSPRASPARATGSVGAATGAAATGAATTGAAAGAAPIEADVSTTDTSGAAGEAASSAAGEAAAPPATGDAAASSAGALPFLLLVDLRRNERILLGVSGSVATWSLY